MIKTCYKVVRKYFADNGVDIEWCSTATSMPGIAVYYNLNEKAVPTVEGTPLFAFDDIENARDYRGEDCFIMECEYSDEDVIRSSDEYFGIISYYDFDFHGPEWLKDKWEKFFASSKEDTLFGAEPYEGTMLVKAITPIRFVE